MRIRIRDLVAGGAVVAFVASGLVFASGLGGTSSASPPAGAASPTPANFDHYLVYMADGVYPTGPPVLFGQPATDFQQRVMGRSEGEIAANRAEAVQLFADRFGLDFASSDRDGSASLHLFVLDPAQHYRAYTISGEYVPAEGWEVRDGGWLVLFGSGGATLHGTWGGPAGTNVPEGSMIAFGDYSIARRRPNGGLDPIVVHYRAIAPMIPATDGSFWFNCELHSDQWGEGRAQGIFAPQPLPGSRLRANQRNVLTFPGYGKS